MYKAPTLQSKQFAIYAIERVKTRLSPGSDAEMHNRYIQITFFDGENPSYFSTYDENLSVKENAQYSLTFSIAKYNGKEINPFFYLIVENRRLRLQTNEQKIDFIITAITPNVTASNTIYNVTCQDVFSYDLSKQSIQISYSNKDSGPENIRTIAYNILKQAKLETKWTLDPSLETGSYATFPSLQYISNSINTGTDRMTITVDFSQTTPFSALTELCEKFDAMMDIEYSDDDKTYGMISFVNKSTIEFKGYNLRPETNLSALSLTRKSDNFCSLMHVSGGEDADGGLVSILPDMPTDVQNYFLSFYPHIISKPDDVPDWDTKTEAEKADFTSYNYCLKYAKASGLKLILTKGWDDKYYLFYNYGSDGNLRYSEPYMGDLDSEKIKKFWTEWDTIDEIKQHFYNVAIEYNDKSKAAVSYYKTSATYNVNQFFTFLRDRCPSGSSIMYNFDYFKNSGLMDDTTYSTLNNIFSKDLKKENILIYCLNAQYYTLKNKLDVYRDKEEEYIAQIASLNEEEYGYANGDNTLSDDNADYTKVLSTNVVIGSVTDNAINTTLSSTTLFNQIVEERKQVLLELISSVFGKEEYNYLLLQLEGIGSVADKISDLEASRTTATANYDYYKNLADGILNTFSTTGELYITDVTDASLLSTLNVVKGTAYYDPGLDANKRYYYKTGEQWKSVSWNGNVLVQVTENAGYKGSNHENNGTYQEGKKFSATCYKDEKKYVITLTAVSTITERAEWLMRNDTVNYVDYSTYVSKANNYFTKVDTVCYLENSDEDKNLFEALQMRINDDVNNAESSQRFMNHITKVNDNKIKIERYGYYTVYINLLKCLENGYLGAWKESSNSFATSFNIVEQKTAAESRRDEIWKNIYENYGDFIVESYYSDTNQLSSSGLFTSALKQFSKYCEPTYEYNTTVINTSTIEDCVDSEIKIGDVVRLYNEEYKSEYSGRLMIQIDKSSGVPYSSNLVPDQRYAYLKSNSEIGMAEDGAPSVIIDQVDNHEYRLNSLLQEITLSFITEDDNYIYIYDSTKTQSTAQWIINHSYYFDTFVSANRAYKVVNIIMERRAAPIELQITGITRKLREGTSQLTISNDRTIDKILARLIKQASR